MRLSKMHIFKYSPRKGTRAAEMKDDVQGKTKEERSNKLIELNKENENLFMNRFISREMDVLYEQKSSSVENGYEGYTPNYIKVIASCKEGIEEGSILKTELYEVSNEVMYGKIK
jgi:threonylcarbamoyladenosine tRNA methylthiotransferase MtaB